jgi:hypothetical protein
MDTDPPTAGPGSALDAYLAEPVLFRNCPVTRSFALRMVDQLEGGDPLSIIGVGELPILTDIDPSQIMDPGTAAQVILRHYETELMLHNWTA